MWTPSYVRRSERCRTGRHRSELNSGLNWPFNRYLTVGSAVLAALGLLYPMVLILHDLASEFWKRFKKRKTARRARKTCCSEPCTWKVRAPPHVLQLVHVRCTRFGALVVPTCRCPPEHRSPSCCARVLVCLCVCVFLSSCLPVFTSSSVSMLTSRSCVLVFMCSCFRAGTME